LSVSLPIVVPPLDYGHAPMETKKLETFQQVIAN